MEIGGNLNMRKIQSATPAFIYLWTKWGIGSTDVPLRYSCVDL